MKKLLALILLVSMTLGLTGCNYLDDLRAHTGYLVSENEIELNGASFQKSKYQLFYYIWDLNDLDDGSDGETSDDDSAGSSSESDYPAAGMAMPAPITYGFFGYDDYDDYDEEYYPETIFDGPYETVYVAEKDVPLLLVRSHGIYSTAKKDGSWIEYDGYYWFRDGKLPENFEEEYLKAVQRNLEEWNSWEEAEDPESSESPEESEESEESEDQEEPSALKPTSDEII